MSLKFSCTCRTTHHGKLKHEMLLPADMCASHRLEFETTHLASATERAISRAALNARDWDDAP